MIDIKEWLKNEQAAIDAEDKSDGDNTTACNKDTTNSENVIDIIGSLDKKKQPADKNQVNVTKIFGVSDKYKLQRLLNPKSTYIRKLVVFNSANKIPNGNNISTISWNYMSDALFQPGTINTKGRIRDIVGMQIYSFRQPPLYYWEGLFYSGFYTYSLYIQEFFNQANLGQNNIPYHFSLTVAENLVSGNYWFIPNNDGYFWFRKPVTALNTITMSMATQFAEPIFMPVDYAWSNMSQVGFTNPATFITNFPTGLQYASGANVIISNFTTGDDIADADIIAAINSPAGFSGTSITSTQFSIPVDLTRAVPYANPNWNLLITVATMELIIPIEFIYINPMNDDD